MKRIFFLSMFIISSVGVSFGGGLYNIYSESYIYGCKGMDDTSDYCKTGEKIVNADIISTGASWTGSYRCGKIDKTAPIISFSGIKPEKAWVNDEGYNPIKDLKVVITDGLAGIRKIEFEIGAAKAIWNFGYKNTKSTFTITYSELCSKLGLGEEGCYKKILKEGINTIKITAYDAVYSYQNGQPDPRNSNKKEKTTEIWIDNSKSKYILTGDNPFYYTGFISGKKLDEKWKNKTLSIGLKVKDAYILKFKTGYCSGKPINSTWIAPAGVNPRTGKFTSYNGSPSKKDCVWDCNSGYVKAANKCIKQEKQLSCKTYFESKGYNLKNIDGKKLFFILDGAKVDPKSGEYTAIYDIKTKKYTPSTAKCRIQGGTTTVIYEEKKAGKTEKNPMGANLLVVNSSTTLSSLADRGQKSCGNLGNLIDFTRGGAGGGGNGDILANFQYFVKGTNGKTAYDAKDHNGNKLINDTSEMEIYYEIKNASGDRFFDKKLKKVCGDTVCVAHAKTLNPSNCMCVSGYYPKDSTPDKIGRYSECIQLPNDKCLTDTNGDGYLDTINTLSSNQIIKLVSNTYSTDKVPVCGGICKKGKPKDYDGDGRPEACEKIDGKCGLTETEEKLLYVYTRDDFRHNCDKPCNVLLGSNWSCKKYDDPDSTTRTYQCRHNGSNCDVTTSVTTSQGSRGENKYFKVTCTSQQVLLNTCSAGDFKDVDDTDTEYKWKCLGINGGKDATCTKNKVPERICNVYDKTGVKKYNGNIYVSYYRYGDHGHCRLLNLRTAKIFDMEHCNNSKNLSNTTVIDYANYISGNGRLYKLNTKDNSCNYNGFKTTTSGEDVLNEIDK